MVVGGGVYPPRRKHTHREQSKAVLVPTGIFPGRLLSCVFHIPNDFRIKVERLLLLKTDG